MVSFLTDVFVFDNMKMSCFFALFHEQNKNKELFFLKENGSKTEIFRKSNHLYIGVEEESQKEREISLKEKERERIEIWVKKLEWQSMPWVATMRHTKL